MVRINKPWSLIVGTVLTMVLMASAQTQRQPETLSVKGYPGETRVIRSQGRVLVDVQDLARITNGSLSFENNRMTLAIPASDGSQSAVDDAAQAGFSPGFRRAAIEGMASIREWGGMVRVIVENGYPIGKAMAENTIRAYQGRAADQVALATAGASTDSDYRSLELLKNEFNNLQAWSDGFIEARNSLSAAALSTSENPLKNDSDARKIIACGEFLAQMFAGGTFQDDPACH
jgi:hypothetical protein